MQRRKNKQLKRDVMIKKESRKQYKKQKYLDNPAPKITYQKGKYQKNPEIKLMYEKCRHQANPENKIKHQEAWYQ